MASRRRTSASEGASRRSGANAHPPAPGLGAEAERAEAFMRLAIDEAKKATGRTSPNPIVGAVIAKGGRLLAAGYHRRAGEDHAEIAALRKLGFDARGCDLYSTLEPCDHVGRTGPCSRAIIEAGIARVFVGAIDPNPRTRRRGLRRLERAGIEVVLGVLEPECRALNETFNYAIRQRRPFVVLKAGMSLDGRIATRNGESRWITSTAARAAGRQMRAELDAILVGVDTVLADDPLLTARAKKGRDPVRVVLDSKLRIPLSSQIVKTARSVRTVVATTAKSPRKRREALEGKGVDVLVLAKGSSGGVDLGALLDALYTRGINGLLVEGGSTVHGAFVDAGLVDKVVLFVAPMLIGGTRARPAIGGRGAAHLSEALRIASWRTERIGPDLMLTGYPRPRAKRARSKSNP